MLWQKNESSAEARVELYLKTGCQCYFHLFYLLYFLYQLTLRKHEVGEIFLHFIRFQGEVESLSCINKTLLYVLSYYMYLAYVYMV